MLDLRNFLSQSDKDTIERYIQLYGVKKDFIGVDEWLKNWAFAKNKLYRLLGNQFSISIPYSYKVDKLILLEEIRNGLLEHPFMTNIYEPFLDNFYQKLCISGGEERVAYQINHNNYDVYCALGKFATRQVYIEEKDKSTITTLKFKLPESKKMLQLQNGMKPFRALGKIIDFFKEWFEEIDTNYKAQYEDFRILHSKIFNTKEITGNLVLSIHPMDFLTMSDNNSNWSSCMSWTNQGCYRVGTIEMLNSNNVLCCYITRKEPFYFDEKNKDYSWNNKRWRILAYFNKDIIMTGKSYPYRNDELCKEILTTLRRLAKQNLNYSYSFGIEPYQDMKHIYSLNHMSNNRSWLYMNNTIKHNIIWDTNGMYNDMFNDHCYTFFCVRNKVKRNKIINVSGKASCLCCGKSIIKERDEDEYDKEYYDVQESYNDKFTNVDAVICTECSKQYTCTRCQLINPLENHYKVTVNGREEILCERCLPFIKLCPCCGNMIDIMVSISGNLPGYYMPPAYIKELTENPKILSRYDYNLKKDKEKMLEPCLVCDNCTDKVAKYFDPFTNDNIRIVKTPFMGTLICNTSDYVRDHLRVRALKEPDFSSFKI